MTSYLNFFHCKKDNKHVQEWHHGELKAPEHVFTMFTTKLEKSEKPLGASIYNVRIGWGEGGPQKADERNRIS